MNVLDAAVKYIDMGFSVVPLSRGTRVPPKGFELSKYFNERATKDKFTEWYKKYPGCNIGIITGQISGVCVVDLDKDKKEYDPSIELEIFPDSLLTPECSTPSGGRHLYFRSPNGSRIPQKAGIFPAIDFKCDESYVVAPPSNLMDGKKYEWIDGLSIETIPPADLPLSIYNKINNSIYGNVTKADKTLLQIDTFVTDGYIWKDGTRDNNLYYVAQCLADCGSDESYISQVLQAIISSWGESDEKWVRAKVKSAFSHMTKKDRNWQEDVDRFIAVTDGHFSVTNCYISLQAVTKQDKGAVRIALMRRKDKTIQKVGTKDGVYTKIDQNMDFIDFDDREIEFHPIKLPMNLNTLVTISPKNIILVAGEYNSGKTTFLMNVLQENKNKVPMRYLSSEMDSDEFKSRFKGYGLPLDFWKPDDFTDYVRLRKDNDYQHCLKPDGINIIDYLEFKESDYTLGAEIMARIHDALGKGVCVVGIQKKEGTRLPRSGDLVLEKPRLVLTLSKVPGEKELIIGEILKGKAHRMGKCDGKKAMYEIKDLGSRFKEERAWGWWK